MLIAHISAKSVRITIISISALITAILSSAFTLSASADAPRIATVEMTRLLADAKDAQEGLKKIEAMRSKAEKELESSVKQLRPKAEKFRKDPDAFNANEVAALRKQEKDLQRLEEDRKSEINKELAELRRTVLSKAIVAIRSVAEEKKIDIVLYKSEDDKVGSPVLYGTDAVDITSEVLKKLK